MSFITRSLQGQKKERSDSGSRRNARITYPDLFWLFIAGSLLGVLLEGVFCIFRYGHWETHTVTILGPFCIIYGIGAAALYVGSIALEKKNVCIQFVVFALAATVIEYFCGAVLKYGLHMRAWDYSNEFLHVDGLICLNFTIVWGLVGVVFSKWIVPALQAAFSKMRGIGWKVACVCLSIFMAVNLLITGICIVRWSQRHQGIAPGNQMERYIDKTWNDSRMEKRFCEWRFIEK